MSVEKWAGPSKVLWYEAKILGAIRLGKLLPRGLLQACIRNFC